MTGKNTEPRQGRLRNAKASQKCWGATSKCTQSFPVILRNACSFDFLQEFSGRSEMANSSGNTLNSVLCSVSSRQMERGLEGREINTQDKYKVNYAILRLTHAAFSTADPELVTTNTIDAIRKKTPMADMAQKFCKCKNKECYRIVDYTT